MSKLTKPPIRLPRCGCPEAKLRACPYKEEIHPDLGKGVQCKCCDVCTYECAQDI